MKTHLSLEQRIHNAVGSQQAENIHARHSYLHAKSFAKEEWGQIWSRRDECSWAHAFGRWRGFENVWYGSVTCYDAACFQRFTQIYEQYPQIGGMDPRPLSEVSCHTLVTDIIEVADDGQTARAYFLTPGLIYSSLNANEKKRCAYLWERYGADFVFEDGQWLFLHEQVCPDIFGNLDDVNWAHSKYDMLKNPPPPPPGGGNPPPRKDQKLQDPGPLHCDWSPIQTVQDTVPWPVPYVTMDNNNTYTPFIGKDHL